MLTKYGFLKKKRYSQNYVLNNFKLNKWNYTFDITYKFSKVLLGSSHTKCDISIQLLIHSS